MTVAIVNARHYHTAFQIDDPGRFACKMSRGLILTYVNEASPTDR